MNKFPSTEVLIFLTLLVLQACTQEGNETSGSQLGAQSNLQSVPASVPEKAVSIAQSLNGGHRAPENRARDAYRHPVETLEFFELNSDHSVVEIWPGKGWYTEILAPVLRAKGKLYVAGFSSKLRARFYREMIEELDETFKANPEIYDRIIVTTFNPPNDIDIAPVESADRVLTFRNVHNWMVKGEELNAFNAMYRALKPGGILGVVEHRANPEEEQDLRAKNGYVQQNYVIRIAKLAGFEFLQASEINANPRDSKDYPNGVWTLPPRLILGDQDKAQYIAIGESDRMTLKFRRPEIY